MIPNHSPWINQLKRTRPIVPLKQDAHADIAIVGGGIAGVATAYFTLRDTDKTVVLLEADKIAHGATGHNAGQITSYFERLLDDLVREFGFELAIDGQRSIESAWALLDEIVTETKLQTPLYRFTGYAGLSSREQVIQRLRDNRHRLNGGLPAESVIIASEWESTAEIPKENRDLYTVIPQKDLLALLETKNPDFIASLSYQKGCMNSALFSEELIGYLIATYPTRFSFYEGSPVATVRLWTQEAELVIDTHTVRAARVVLCTNGFEDFTIINEGDAEIDTKFHHLLTGRIGYMSGYIEPLRNSPTAISYFPKTALQTDDPTGESYFYLTRRPHEHEGKDSYNLTCTGGPEKTLLHGEKYSRHSPFPAHTRALIDMFLQNNYARYPEGSTEYLFCWHGLMGYTPNGIRRVGIEPCNPILLYNLGCNGVGILPSVYGAKRIARLLRGEKLNPSIFDPHDQRCEVHARV